MHKNSDHDKLDQLLQTVKSVEPDLHCGKVSFSLHDSQVRFSTVGPPTYEALKGKHTHIQSIGEQT